MSGYRALDPAKVIETIGRLHQRICERFPGAGLAGVAAELLQIARENSARAERSGRPSAAAMSWRNWSKPSAASSASNAPLSGKCL